MLSDFFSKFTNDLPEECGVYLMRSSSGDLLYIGKAKNIRKRVGSYFFNRENERRQVPHLIKKIHKVDWIVTDNESEALILEANLIRKYKPPYNIDLKDDKRYPFLEITIDEKYPRLLITRRPGKKSICFGPYIDVTSIRKLASFARKVFKIRTCRKTIKGSRTERPCLNHSIKQCSAPCAGKISFQEYQENVEHLKRFISGENTRLLKILKNKMKSSSEKLDFEQAASLRDQINMIKNTKFFQNVDLVSEDSSVDVFGFYDDGKSICVCVNSFRKGFLISKFSFVISSDSKEIKAQDHEMVIINFYENRNRDIPSEIILPFSFEVNREALSLFFKKTTGKNVKFTSPRRGTKTRLVAMAEKNAKLNLISKKNRTAERARDLYSLKKALNLPTVPGIIDAFDISNLSDDFPAAGIVRFKNGIPERKLYRAYRIKSIMTQNDFAMIEEAVSRRLNNLEKEKAPFPDLIIIDGGKAQLNSALNALSKFKKQPAVISIAKKEELIFLPGKEEPVELPSSNPGKKLVQRIRNEVHRKAISYHRNMRGKLYNRSRLENIRGVGPEKSRALIRHFGSLKNISQTSAGEIVKVPGFSEELAKKIINELKT